LELSGHGRYDLNVPKCCCQTSWPLRRRAWSDSVWLAGWDDRGSETGNSNNQEGRSSRIMQCINLVFYYHYALIYMQDELLLTNQQLFLFCAVGWHPWSRGPV
jgi:putative NADPH-quinone reductase